MISFQGVSKTHPGRDGYAVHDLTLTIREGETTVLIGPSGCGKSTTMRMANRLLEPDDGRIEIGGRDVKSIKPEALRRHIGYVIQGVGLFPHWTVRENIGIVPGLLGWDPTRTDERVATLLNLVGLDAVEYGSKYPDQLSGGEAQRVGVARALAADPPVLLMDEPFGAVDPLTRERLQTEFIAIQKRLRKTVLFVTHDIDEAVKLGDRIAVMRAGELLQYDTPERVLAYPANDFIASFVGTDRALKRLSLARVRDALLPLTDTDTAKPRLTVPVDGDMRTALARILESGEDCGAVADDSGAIIGKVSVESILARFKRPLP